MPVVSVTAAGITGGNPLEMTAAVRAISTSVNEPRRAIHASAVIAKGASANFTITADVNGAAIPDLFYVDAVIIVPSALSLYRVRMFAKSTRNLNDPMMYEWPYGGNALHTYDATGSWLENLDLSKRIMGTIEVHATSANTASFDITILYSVRRRPYVP